MVDRSLDSVYGKTSFWSYAVLLGLGYLAFYGWLLARSGGFPYVMDNNESFSSLWHASNMFHFGLESTFGLTDEAFSSSSAAHPYVYTHQGNFPRIPALLFYALGARDIESQIYATTFTTGLAAAFLAYSFLSHLTRNFTFSALACAIIFSDYVLVAQWQVVTYRVWHAFFFFATLHCIHGLEGRRVWRASFLLLINTVCLTYFELAFAAFMIAFAGLYVLLRNIRNFRLVALAGGLLSVGCLVGAGMLCLQIILYMGWDSFVKDLTYTYTARNQFSDGEAMVRTLRGFFDSNRIVFWYNLFDASGFRTPWHFLASIGYFELQPHTPYFILLLLIPALGYFAALLPQLGKLCLSKASAFPYAGRVMEAILVSGKRCFLLATTLVVPLILVVAHLLHRAHSEEFGAVQLLGVFFGVAGVARIAFINRGCQRDCERAIALASALLLFAVLPSVFQYYDLVRSKLGYATWPVNLFSGTFFALLVWNFYLGTAHETSLLGMSPRRKLFEIVMFLVTSSVLAGLLWGSALALGMRPVGSWIRLEDILFGVVAAVGMGVLLARSYQTGRSGWVSWVVPAEEGLVTMSRVWRFNLALIAVFVIQSFLFNQSYRPVWWALITDSIPEHTLRSLMALAVLLSIALMITGKSETIDERRIAWLPKVGIFLVAGYLAYAIVYLLSPGYIFTGYRFRFTPFSVFVTDVVLACGVWLFARSAIEMSARFRLYPLAGFSVSVFPVAFWILLQSAQISLLPPEQFTTLKKVLSSPPYKGASFVSNMYAAPVAAFTGQWAYLDPELGEARVEYRGGYRRLKTDDRYLWLADRDTNPDYSRPEYFLCMIPQSLPSLAAKLLKDQGGASYRGCADLGIVKHARAASGDVVPRTEVVAIDVEGRQKFGYETWAIVKLDWGS